MKILLKYFLWLLSLSTLLIFFVINTQLGHQTIGFFLGTYLSVKTNNDIHIKNFDMKAYPHLIIDMKINNSMNVHLEGLGNKKEVDMDYHLYANKYLWNSTVLDGKMDVKGHVKGLLSNVYVTGKGRVFDGTSTYSFTKVPKKYVNMNVTLSNVKSNEVLKFLKQRPLVRGRANIESSFKTFSRHEKEGSSKISMSRGFMPLLAPYVPFVLDANIGFKDFNHTFNGEINSEIGSLTIDNAHYHKSKKEGEGSYALRLKELSYFREFIAKSLKHPYKGSLDTNGTLHFEKDSLWVKGVTDKFGGLLNYDYDKQMLNLDLEGVSLEKMLKEHDYPTPLSSKIYGNVNYNVNNKLMLIDTKLNETRFKKTKMTDMIFKATGIDMLADDYNDSSFKGSYHNGYLSATLKIDNGVNHFYLTDTLLNKKGNTVDSKFEVLMRGEEIRGDIYGTLSDPKVSVNMKRLIKTQVEKRVSSLLSDDNKKQLKDGLEKLKNINVEDVKRKAGSFLDELF